MFKKILIANRGEIAVRIIRACNEMGILTVAIYAKGEEQQLHVQLADEAVCIGPLRLKDTYLSKTAILSAAIATGAEAIHPGVGFLSENSEFAERCIELGITFIGPSAKVMEKMGNKSEAKKMAQKAKVPVVYGSPDALRSVDEARKLAKKVGYPLLIKAVSGGGGKGMRLVQKEEELETAYKAARFEAKTSFGDDSVYMEKFIVNPKHIEVQILADKYGNVVHLGERDCSIQRNSQKMIEEAPSIFLNGKLRRSMGEAAIRLAKHVNYVGLGTVEFLVDYQGQFYFMEMNTRLQVEHTITEEITGIDLVKEQIAIAYGKKLHIKQKDVTFNGHAIECRINAENPYNNFTPSPGDVTSVIFAGGNGIRIDSAIFQGARVLPTFDSLIAKIIVHGATRDEAIARMKRALEETVISPIETNIDFHYEIINHQMFHEGRIDTSFINQYFSEVLNKDAKING
jgi:acetyl-CoA carboxylase, biotin carboxylase subunit